MPHITEDPFRAYLNALMMRMIGLLLGSLLTGALLALGIASLPLLSLRGGDKNLLRRNRFLCAYIIMLLPIVLVFDAEGFLVTNGNDIFFSQPQNTIQKVWCPTLVVIILLADGVLVRLSEYSPFNFYKQVLPQGVEVFYGSKSPWTFQLIQVGKHLLDISCLSMGLNTGYERRI